VLGNTNSGDGTHVIAKADDAFLLAAKLEIPAASRFFAISPANRGSFTCTTMMRTTRIRRCMRSFQQAFIISRTSAAIPIFHVACPRIAITRPDEAGRNPVLTVTDESAQPMSRFPIEVEDQAQSRASLCTKGTRANPFRGLE